MAIEVTIPTLHAGQVTVWRNRSRLNVVRCGRRWGKTKLLVTIAADTVLKRRNAGIFTPEYKQLLEPYDDLKEILAPLGGRSSKTDGMMRPEKIRGKLDFWTLNDNELAGRGREYHKVGLDEAAFGKANLIDIWDKSIRPTLLTTRGEAWLFSTPKGVNKDNLFYRACNDPSLEFKEHYAPTSTNPYVPLDELERLRTKTHPLVFAQEYEAKFIDWTGVQFFELSKLMMPDGQPAKMPTRCDTVFAVIDTAIKTGKEHDGTAVIYFAYSRFEAPQLIILDYDKIQIEGSLLETWLPTVYQRIESLQQECGARMPSLGAFIEDKGSGTILLQQAERRGWQAQAIDSKLTAMGKDERAISVSGYVYQGLIKMAKCAYDKLINYKGSNDNHLVTELTSFRIGDKDQKRADDLTDCFTYGISLTLGNADGY